MDDRKEKSMRPKSRQSLAHISSKSNTTTDLTTLKRNAEVKGTGKRGRGKSIGPGGLEALTETDANALKIPSAFQPRSILKPTIPLTPPKVIPSFDELRKRSTTKAKSPSKAVPEELLIDFSTPGPNRSSGTTLLDSADFAFVDPFSPAGEAVRAHSPGNSTLDEDEDKDEQRRQAEKKAALEHRAARRKSLANRRVSFAPEATLHTWSVMELVEDSTSSSAANSTRRQSSMTTATQPSNQAPGTPAKAPQSSSSESQMNGSTPYRNNHKRRRSSALDPTLDEDEIFSSPGDAADSSPVHVEESIGSESDTDGDTAMSLDDATETSVRSSASSSTQNSLDERLRQAASFAGTRGIDHDETSIEDDDDQPMDIADTTVTHAFRQQSGSRASGHGTPVGAADKENIDVFRDPISNGEGEATMGMTTDMTMDMTRAVGGILSNPARFKDDADENQVPSYTLFGSNDQTSYSDETMDFTVAKGGIISDLQNDDTESDEDMTMEMTNVVGGLRHGNQTADQSFTLEETESMDMTVAGGRILPSIEEQTEPQSFIDEGFTVAMDMTKSIGGIIEFAGEDAKYPQLPTLPPLKEGDVDLQEQAIPDDPTQDNDAPSARKGGPMAHAASETGSPTLKPRHSASRRANDNISSTPRSTLTRTPTQSHIQSTPRTKNETSLQRDIDNGTPVKQITPAPMRGTSPIRTPVLTANVATRSASPKKLFQHEIRQRASPSARRSPRRQQDVLFARDENTGLQTPRVVLHAPKPHQHFRRKSSGIGIDKIASTSPRVSEVLSRRVSLSETVPSYQLQLDIPRAKDESDPRQLQQQIDAERLEEHRRESGRFIMEQEANELPEDDTTHNLRDMIESMTPRKNNLVSKVKSRKSLAVGSAKGLLGKRPAELDGDEEDEEVTPKRLRTISRGASPIKNIPIPKAPQSEKTTGCLPKAAQIRRDALAHPTTTPTSTPSSSRRIKSPEVTGRFKDSTITRKPISFEDRLDNVITATDVATVHPEKVNDNQEESVSLQQFLNLTNVHFIELSTTKRRQTLAALESREDNDNAIYTSEAAFVAAASKLPQLDLYQHATRELNSYISSGRKDIRQIEAELLAEQPPIFREYIDATPDVRAVMDDQFRDVKTRARLQSKESWYTWRSQLVDGLQNGLEGIKTELDQDLAILSQQKAAIVEVLPELRTNKPELLQQVGALRGHYQELDAVDHAALQSQRSRLSQLDSQVAEHRRTLSDLQRQLREKDEVLSQVSELRAEIDDQITEAKRVQDDQGRWHRVKVARLKAELERLQDETGWKLLDIETLGSNRDDLAIALKLAYKGLLELTFCPNALQDKQDALHSSSSMDHSETTTIHPIHLKYRPHDTESDRLLESPAELTFFVKYVESQLNSVDETTKGSISVQHLLGIVADGWLVAQKVSSEIAILSKMGIVRVTSPRDNTLCASLMLLQDDRSRIDIRFTLELTTDRDSHLSTSSTVTADAIYGTALSIMDASKTRKVQAALSREIASRPLGNGSWSNAVKGFQEWAGSQVQAQMRLPAEVEKSNVPVAKKEVISNDSKDLNGTTTSQKRRAVTISPQRGSTPKKPARSPLAPRTTNSKIQRKALPVPKKVLQMESQIPIATQKENISIGPGKSSQNTEAVDEKMNYDDVFGIPKAAIPPEMQEAMMHTPVQRRAGALRRSPY